jgi:hypothetical protein
MSDVINLSSYSNGYADCSLTVSTSMTQFPATGKPNEFTYHMWLRSGEEAIDLDFSDIQDALKFIELFKKSI